MKILVLGAGRMGFGAAFDLIYNSSGVTAVTVADYDFVKAKKLSERINSPRLNFIGADLSEKETAAKLFSEHDAVISCINYWYNAQLSEIAVKTKTNFCDLGGNNTVVDKQLLLDEKARQAGINIIPDCGLAPGMVSILAMHGAKKFDEVSEILIRVGGLPQNPQPPLDYQLVFSVEGLINEYVEKARVVRNGKIAEIESMTELEPIVFEGFPPLEAFQTSGGTSTLPDTFAGKVTELDYKTIRYAGHCEKFKTMIDLGLCSSKEMKFEDVKIIPRRFFAELLQRALPADEPDYVLVRVEVKGFDNGEKKTVKYDIVDKYDEKSGLSAMMRTTAFPASIIAQMTVKGEVNMRGATPQEKAVDSEKFIAELSRRNIEIIESYK